MIQSLVTCCDLNITDFRKFAELCFVCVVLKASVPVGQIKLENIETKTISSEDVSSEFEQGN